MNGPNSSVDVVPGTNYVLVGCLSEGLVELWVNPDMANPGSSDVSRKPASQADFVFSRLDDGVYELDEFRMGYTWGEVAPYKG